MRHRQYDRGCDLDSICQFASRGWNKISEKFPIRLAKHYALRLFVAVAMVGITTPHLSSQALYGAVTGNVYGQLGSRRAGCRSNDCQ